MLGLLGGLTALPASAEWTGEGELGWMASRGNSKASSFNAGAKLKFTSDPWENQFRASYIDSRDDDGGETANRFQAEDRTLYSFTERDYFFGALRYDRDKFSSFEYQGTGAAGYGRRLIMTERHDLLAEIGPGVRRSKVRDTGETDTEIIARGFAEYAWQISETAKFTNRLLVESGKENTFAENEAALGVAINAFLSLRLGVAVRHNTEVEPGFKKTDTITTANLVFNFGE